MMYPSIFNDVLGPVMRGPSSSHCAAALRIGRICRDLMKGDIREAHITFDPNGSLATTHKSQGSDMGLFGGFLGWNADDPRLPDYQDGIAQEGIDLHIAIADIGAQHPNTYQISLKNSTQQHQLVALSTGGGMIEIIGIDGAETELYGDYVVTLVYTSHPDSLCEECRTSMDFESLEIRKGNKLFIEICTRDPIPENILKKWRDKNEVNYLAVIHPVLPVLSRKNCSVPFVNAKQMLEYNSDKNLSLFELALLYEQERGDLSREDVLGKTHEIVDVMKTSVSTGLAGTNYHDRILGNQSSEFREKMAAGNLMGGEVLNRMILYVSSIMEVKSSMGVIVAAPTAGSCGALPGAILGAADAMNFSDDEVIRAMLIAGLIGVFIGANATFAAEVGGCQAECGSGSCMAAAGLVYLAGGTLEHSLAAASLALQNSLGMICDPVANRVEAPCLGKNVLAASNALSCANMALSNYDPLIPLDQVIDAMKKVSGQMAHELRCTGLGGLSATPASKAIENRLNEVRPSQLQEDLGSISKRFKVC